MAEQKPTHPDIAPLAFTPIPAATPVSDGSHYALDDGRVIQGSQDAPSASPIELYTPHADVFETQDDGRVIQLATKGVPMPMAHAHAVGLVKAPAARGPQETK